MLKWWWYLTVLGKASNSCHLLTGFMVLVCLFFWVHPSHTQHFVNSALQAHIFNLCFYLTLWYLVQLHEVGLYHGGRNELLGGGEDWARQSSSAQLSLLGSPLQVSSPCHQLCTSNTYKSIAFHIKILDHVKSCKTAMRLSDPNDRLSNLLALIPHLIL